MEKTNAKNYIISADIGGSHITAAVIDVDRKYVVEGTRVGAQVNCHGGVSEILSAWIKVFTNIRDCFPTPINRLALAMPGPFDYENGISRIRGLQKYESLYGINVKQYIADALKIDAQNILFRNDAEAFLHGEVVAGLASPHEKVLGFTLGTGMGSAISQRGVTWDANWGSDLFGKTIADDYLSTRWF
jgi:glucokinase